MARILVTEDDAQAREMIVRICQFQGHEVEEARDGVRACDRPSRAGAKAGYSDLSPSPVSSVLPASVHARRPPRSVRTSLCPNPMSRLLIPSATGSL